MVLGTFFVHTSVRSWSGWTIFNSTNCWSASREAGFSLEVLKNGAWSGREGWQAGALGSWPPTPNQIWKALAISRSHGIYSFNWPSSHLLPRSCFIWQMVDEGRRLKSRGAYGSLCFECLPQVTCLSHVSFYLLTVVLQNSSVIVILPVFRCMCWGGATGPRPCD